MYILYYIRYYIFIICRHFEEAQSVDSNYLQGTHKILALMLKYKNCKHKSM
jgi:hypothetical protein